MVNSATLLLLKSYTPAPSDHFLILEGGDGDMARAVANLVPDGEVITLARDIRQVEKARNLLAAFPNASANTDVLPKAGKQVDTIILNVPKGRRYARALMMSAWYALQKGGVLYIIGHAQMGVNAVFKDAERLFGSAAVLDYKSHQRLARSIRGEALPDPLPQEFNEPGILPDTSREIILPRPEGDLRLESHPGIFSWDAIDEGTQLLLDHLKIKPGERVWDVGCGIGAIGLAAALAGASQVAMSDVNLLAVAYAQRNAETNGLADRVSVFAFDGISAEFRKLDFIVSNPTFHENQVVDTSMADRLIENAPAILTPGGRLLLVANRFLNYDRRMRKYFSQVDRIAETPQYHLLEGRIR